MSRNVVRFGAKDCVVLESTASEITCRTESGSSVMNVDNSGSHPG